MKSILSISTARPRKPVHGTIRRPRRFHPHAPSIISLEERVVMATSASYFMPSPYNSGTSSYMPVGTVDRARISFINTDNTSWFVDYTSFTPSDITITRNGGSDIDLSNGTPGQYKIGIVGSQTNQNTYYIIGLPRVALATGDYTLRVSGTVDFLETNPDFDSSIPVSVSNPVNIIVSANQSVTGSLAWKQRSGTVAAWGGNTSGQTSVPVGLTNVVDVAAGGSFSLALKADGTVSAWGSGAGATALPVSLTNVVAIAAGDNHALALKQDGSIVSWGTNNNSVVSNSPITGNYYSIGAGVNVSFAIGTYTGSTTSINSGTDGTLTTWGQYTSFGEDLFVEDTPVQGLIQASLANDFMVGVLADSSFFSFGNVPADQPDLSETTINQAIAGVNPTSTTSKFVFVLKSDNNVKGWGDNTSGQLTGVTSPINYAALLGTTSVALVSSSRLEAGSLDTVSLSSASNSIQAWGYNGNPADNRVSGGSAYISTVIPSPSVGSVSAGTIQTLAQVMDLTAPTISSFVAVTASPTSVMPLKYRLTFSEPITNTLDAADFLAVYSKSPLSQSYFTVTGVTAVSTTIFDVTVGTLGNIPSNFSDNIYLQMVSNANTQQIRDVAGNQLSTALPSKTSNFVQFLTEAAPTSLASTSGTAFNSLQYVAPSTITFTITFSYYVSDSASGGAADPRNYTLTILTGSLTGNQIQSIVPVPDATAPFDPITLVKYYKQFTISVSTGTPGTNAAANFNLKLNAGSNIPVYQDPTNPITQTITSNTIRVDNLTPTITSVFPSTSSGVAVTGTSLVVFGTNANTVYFTAQFDDVVNFSGAAGLISNYFSFTTGSFRGTTNTVSAFVTLITAQATLNTPASPPAPTYSDIWVVSVSTSGTGTLGMTVNPSYTQSSTTYSIVNPVSTVVPGAVASTLTWSVSRYVFQSSIVNGPLGLNPSNPDGLSTIQRSRVANVQIQFDNPVAYDLGSSNYRALINTDFILYKYDTNTSSWITAPGVTLAIAATEQSVIGGKSAFYKTYSVTFKDSSANTLWSLEDGNYQLSLKPVSSASPPVIDDLGDTFSYGGTDWQAQTAFYRFFGDSMGTGTVGNLDALYFYDAYGQTSAFTDWSFLSFDGTDPIGNIDSLFFQDNYSLTITIPNPRPLP